jgi:Co/Zn/Cd efflux system component
VALVLNLAMFAVEAASGLYSRSAALQADALDFLGDSANFGIGLSVLATTPGRRANAALAKGAGMAAFGLWVLASALWRAWFGTAPMAEVMGVVGLVALLVNGSVAGMLYAYRGGDSNRRSVWICARNDSIANCAVMLAAAGVATTGSHWPDIAVALGIGTLNMVGAAGIIRHAWRERGEALAVA